MDQGRKLLIQDKLSIFRAMAFVQLIIMRNQQAESNRKPTQSLKEDLISVYKLIDRPKDLIDKTIINKLYAESWQRPEFNMSLSIFASETEKQRKQQKHCSTQMQFRNMVKPSFGFRNTRYNKQEKLSLQQNQKQGIFGELVYQRISGREDWNWVIKPSNLNPYQRNENLKQDNHGVTFCSRFEGGNLFRAYKSHGPNNLFILLTQNDTNTKGYNQWFYFKVKCSKAFETLRFQIVNMRKRYSSFSRGMKIAVYSNIKWKREKVGWHRGGENVTYLENQILSGWGVGQNFSSLGWDYLFEQKNEWVYFAYSYPYTYTDLKQTVKRTKKMRAAGFQWSTVCLSALKNEIYMLKVQKIDSQQLQMERNEKREEFFSLQKQKSKEFEKVNKLSKKKREFSFSLKRQQTLSKTIVHYTKNFQSLQISKSKKKKQSINKKLHQEKPVNKQVLILLARAHPGQTPSSFMAEGIIHSLLKQSNNEIRYLKENLIIYVFPMLNPDGVIHGNTRTSLTGNDLNRRWSNPNEYLHPQIHRIKLFIKDLIKKGKKIFAVIDLHAHTKKQSSFIYGCCDRKNYQNYGEVKLLNQLMSKADQNFNRLYSSYNISEEKHSTARVTFYRQLGCLSYTFELSFLGACNGAYHFSTKDYANLGSNLLKSIAYLLIARKKKTKKTKQSVSYWQSRFNNQALQQTVKQYLEKDKVILQSELGEELQKESKGSSSAPSECNYRQDHLIKNIFPQQLSANPSLNTRYLMSSNKRIKTRNLSLSIDDKRKKRNDETMQMKKNLVKQQRQKVLSKLPLINYQLREKQEEKEEKSDFSEFHTFNFKNKKTMWRFGRKNLGVYEQTID